MSWSVLSFFVPERRVTDLRSPLDLADINYVHQLVSAHVRNGDFTEAGLSLKLHASLYDWNRNAFVDPFVYGELELPRQSQFGRKESLYLQTLDYLGEFRVRFALVQSWRAVRADPFNSTTAGRGKSYELAIEVCKELEWQHQHTTYD